MKRKVPLFKIHIGQGATYSQLTEIPGMKDIVIGELVAAVKDAIKYKRKKTNLFEVAGSGYYIELKKEQYKSLLETALEYFSKKEEYDRCIECRDLIKELK